MAALRWIFHFILVTTTVCLYVLSVFLCADLEFETLLTLPPDAGVTTGISYHIRKGMYICVFLYVLVYTGVYIHH